MVAPPEGRGGAAPRQGPSWTAGNHAKQSPLLAHKESQSPQGAALWGCGGGVSTSAEEENSW